MWTIVCEKKLHNPVLRIQWSQKIDVIFSAMFFDDQIDWVKFVLLSGIKIINRFPVVIFSKGPSISMAISSKGPLVGNSSRAVFSWEKHFPCPVAAIADCLVKVVGIVLPVYLAVHGGVDETLAGVFCKVLVIRGKGGVDKGSLAPQFLLHHHARRCQLRSQ